MIEEEGVEKGVEKRVLVEGVELVDVGLVDVGLVDVELVDWRVLKSGRNAG